MRSSAGARSGAEAESSGERIVSRRPAPRRDGRSGSAADRLLRTVAAVLPAAVLAASGCAPGGARRGPVGPGPVPYADTLPIAEPEARQPGEISELLKEAVREEVGHALSPRRLLSGAGEALNVTARDGVVPSAWYEPRITARPLSPEELAAGPPGADPDTTAPLTVVGGKVGGVSPGFTVRDRKGDTYLLKFDPAGHPGLASGADVIASRLFWAAGYHVPRDVVITIRPEELEIGEGVTVETTGGERPMRREDVRRVLTSTDSLPDGRYRALASLFVPGLPKGPFRFEGRRSDDPNDYYPHEDRRELRGLWVMAAWTGHVDLRFQNTMDVWIDPPGYLRHYLIDFGATLGSRSIRVANAREGREHAFDLWPSLGRLATLGLYRVGWEGTDDAPIHPSVGWIATDSFDPGAWKPFWPNDAYRSMTVRDAYWGAKLVGAFDRAHLEAVVREAAYPDPAAADTLVDILELRQRKVLRHWYGRVTPVEDVAVDGASRGDGGPAADSVRLRFRDLGLAEGLWSVGATRYRWRMEGPEGTVRGGRARASDGAGQQLTLPAPAGSGDGPGPVTAEPAEEEPARYAASGRSWTLELTAVRPGTDRRPATATIVPDGKGYRIVRLIH